jgi:hypothetical protein
MEASHCPESAVGSSGYGIQNELVMDGSVYAQTQDSIKTNLVKVTQYAMK